MNAMRQTRRLAGFFILIYCSINVIVHAQSIEEVTVTTEFIPDEKLATAEVSELLDADDISITDDSNVGEALKRLPGLSLVGGKYLYVRGLGERYSSTYFNGTPLPGIEPLKRAVPLDLFDTSVTSNIMVQKTYSANFGSEFSGGIVDIRSAGLPDENFFELKIGSGFNENSTGRTGLTYRGGDDDEWGFDDGTRALPQLLKDRNGGQRLTGGIPPFGLPYEIRDQLRFSFTNNVWTATEKQNPYDQSASAAVGRRWQAADDWSVGLIGTFSYSNNYRNRFIERSRWGNLALGDPDYINLNDADIAKLRSIFLEFGDNIPPGSNLPVSGVGLTDGTEDARRTLNTIGLTGLISLGVEFQNIHSIKFTNMFLRKTTDEASVTRTRVTNFNSLELLQTRLEWAENQIGFMQLAGEHLLESMTVSWRYAETRGDRETPDTRSHTLFRDADNTNPLTQGQFGISRREADPFREFTVLSDKGEEIGVDLDIPLVRDSRVISSMALKVGYSKFDKNREYEGDRFNYEVNALANSADDPLYFLPIEVLLDPSNCVVGGDAPGPNDLNDNCYLAERDEISTGLNFDSPGSIDIYEGFQIGRPDAYTGAETYEATYLALDMSITDYFRANIGVRNENAEIAVKPSIGAGTSLKSKSALPAVSLTWDFYDNMQLRAAYSESVNRPILRELAEVRIYNADDGRQYQGNANLKIAEIDNYDLRYEWYFGSADYLSVSTFLKKIKNPIETADEDIGDGSVVTWQNIDAAKNEGYEFEIRKYFGDYFFITANATKINSTTVDNRAFASQIFSTPSRPLFGVSKEIYNAQFVFENEWSSVSLAWNKYSKRLYTVIGSNGALVYEEPYQSLDLNIKLKMLRDEDVITLGMKGSNLLDSDKEFNYFNGLPYERYEVGQTYSMSIEYKHSSW